MGRAYDEHGPGLIHVEALCSHALHCLHESCLTAVVSRRNKFDCHLAAHEQAIHHR